MKTARAVLLAMLSTLAAAPAGAQAWHHPLYIGNGGVWRLRVPIEIRNDMARDAQGEPVELRVDSGPGQVPIAGLAAEEVRVCNGDGEELLFHIATPEGREVAAGPIPEGAVLTIPAECPAESTSVCWVYADNPLAWPVPDFLQSFARPRNCGVEAGNDGTPYGWRHDPGDPQHRALWVTERPHSGKYCLKTVVDAGAEPSWIATRQGGIWVEGGRRYRLTGWVRAEEVEGYTGWYVHVGNAEQAMMIAPMARAGGGTFDWKQVSVEFTTPADANRLSFGTVLWGTGTAWFDDVALESLDGPAALTARAGAPERLQLAETGAEAQWLDERFPYRVPLTVANVTDEARAETLIIVPLAPIVGRLVGTVNSTSLCAAAGDERLDGCIVGDWFVFVADLPARTLRTFYLYFSDDPESEVPTGSSYEALVHSRANLVRNPDFELGGELPEEWPGGSEGRQPGRVELARVPDGLFGRWAVRMHIPADAAGSWTGWRQHVPVKPMRSYIYAAWVRTQDVAGSVRLHAHYRNAAGELCKTKQYTGTGESLTGTNDWTLLAGLFDMPPDIATFQLHLTMNTSGTVWHDGVLLAEVAVGHVGAMETQPSRRVTAPTMWPVNPMVKVFRDDPAPATIAPARITAARNEIEPLQLALRAERALDDLSVAVEPPKNSNGEALPPPEIALVGYVPVDHPTSYYTSQAPAWHRKFPTASGRCDGWAGWWPDPLPPARSFDLPAYTTQPIWVNVRVPRDARPGSYRGMVRILHGSSLLTALPFTVRVWDFALPEQIHLKAIYDARGTDPRWALPGDSKNEPVRRMWRLMAEHRVCPDRVRPGPVFKYEDGRVTADFTDFDAAARYYFEELGFTHSYTPWLLYSFGWGHPPKALWGIQPYEGDFPFDGVERGVLRPEYRRVYQQMLQLFWEHVIERGWADRFVLYISDEPWFRSRDYIVDQMKALCDMVHEVSPDIPIYASTWSYLPAWQGYLNIWGVGHYGSVTLQELKTIQADGSRVWWTTDGQMCLDTPYCAIERLLLHYCFKYGAEAYEFWGIDWLTYDPWQFGWHMFISQSGEPGRRTWTRYPNGDGYLAYPGAPVRVDGPVSSLRLEMAREGIEDYEYLWLLQDLVEQGRGAGLDVSRGERALTRAHELVDMPNQGGRYSTAILPDPDRLLRVREELARAIEELNERLGR